MALFIILSSITKSSVPLCPVFMLSYNLCPLYKLLSSSNAVSHLTLSLPLVFAVSWVVLLYQERGFSPTKISSLYISQRTFFRFLCFIGSYLKKCKIPSHGTVPKKNKTIAYNQKCNFSHNCKLVLQEHLRHWDLPHQNVLSYSFYLLLEFLVPQGPTAAFLLINIQVLIIIYKLLPNG